MTSIIAIDGRNGSRYTRDIDTTRVMELNSYLAQLNAALVQGWSGFSGKIVPVEPPQPTGVPSVYVMMPYDIKSVRMSLTHLVLWSPIISSYGLKEFCLMV